MSPAGPALDRFELYELCAQAPPELVRMLRAIHGGEPKVLGEDFCGTAALSAEWVRQVDGGAAIAVDHDAAALERAAGRAGAGPGSAIRTTLGDVVAGTDPGRDRADVIHAGNFSIGERRDRPALLAYLRHARARLSPGGVFVCDVYGGESAYLRGEIDRDVPDPGGEAGDIVRYTWEQREADPLTGLVVNALHFLIVCGGRTVAELRDAFVYTWRLWGVPELRDAIAEAGFAGSEVYARTPDAVDETGRAYVSALRGAEDLDDSFDVLVAGRTG